MGHGSLENFPIDNSQKKFDSARFRHTRSGNRKQHFFISLKVCKSLIQYRNLVLL